MNKNKIKKLSDYKSWSDMGKKADFIAQHLDVSKELIDKSEEQILLDALSKIDDIVDSDFGFAADCYLALDKERDSKASQTDIDEWARMIMDIYRITHELLHSCCGGKKAKRRRNILEKSNE